MTARCTLQAPSYSRSSVPNILHIPNIPYQHTSTARVSEHGKQKKFTLRHVYTGSDISYQIISIPVQFIFYHFVQWTNKCTQLFHKLSNCYMFRHCRVILRQPVINTCTVHLLSFCTMNQQMHTIISQIITLLHVSTLSCHPQTACNQYLAQLHRYIPASINIQTVYTATTLTDWLTENCSNIMILASFIVNRTILVF